LALSQLLCLLYPQHGLDSFDLDGGLTYLENEPLENIETLSLYHERYIFVCRADHPFANLPAISWQMAVEEPLCLLSEDMQNRRILDSLSRSLGLQLRPSVVANSVLAICAHIRNGGWCSIIPHTFFYIFGNQTNLASTPLQDDFSPQAIGLVTSNRLPQSPMTRALIQALKGLSFDQEFGV